MAKSGKSIDRVVQLLEDDVFSAYVRWLFYRQLFLSRRDRELLDTYLGNFAYVLQVMLVDDLFLRLSRLIDRSSTRRGDNLSFNMVIKRIDEERGFPRLRWAWTAFNRIVKECLEVQRHRNKRIGHSNVDVRLGLVSPLKPVARKSIAKIFKDIELLMQRIDRAAGRHPMSFFELVQNGDGETLLLQLRRVEELRKAAASEDGDAYKIIIDAAGKS